MAIIQPAADLVGCFGARALADAVDMYDCSHGKWFAALMFGAIVSATDPVAVVAVLNTLGAQPKLSHMIEGESLFVGSGRRWEKDRPAVRRNILQLINERYGTK